MAVGRNEMTRHEMIDATLSANIVFFIPSPLDFDQTHSEINSVIERWSAAMTG